MANYNCVIRTNYFHVKDADNFRRLMGDVYGEGDINVWEERDSDGQTVFGFGTYGSISGIKRTKSMECGAFDDSDDETYDDFIDELQKSVCDNDAIIILESGNEKLRYLIGSATIITSKYYKYMEIGREAVKYVSGILNDRNWDTRIDY